MRDITMNLIQKILKNFEYCSVGFIVISFVIFSAVPVLSATFVVDRIDDESRILSLHECFK
jgi:hypothetical protein